MISQWYSYSLTLGSYPRTLLSGPFWQKTSMLAYYLSLNHGVLNLNKYCSFVAQIWPNHNSTGLKLWSLGWKFCVRSFNPPQTAPLPKLPNNLSLFKTSNLVPVFSSTICSYSIISTWAWGVLKGSTNLCSLLDQINQTTGLKSPIWIYNNTTRSTAPRSLFGVSKPLWLAQSNAQRHRDGCRCTASYIWI